MPKYTMLCEGCAASKEVVHSIKEKPDILCECGALMHRTIGNPSVHLKGDQWSGKLLKEKDLRKRNSSLLDRKQRVEHSLDKVLPNVDGEVVSSWSDAKRLAKEKGYNTSSYDKFGKK